MEQNPHISSSHRQRDMDKLLRYEAMISRQLNHATAELERLQARRKGEACMAGESINPAKQSQEVL